MRMIRAKFQQWLGNWVPIGRVNLRYESRGRYSDRMVRGCYRWLSGKRVWRDASEGPQLPVACRDPPKSHLDLSNRGPLARPHPLFFCFQFFESFRSGVKSLKKNSQLGLAQSSEGVLMAGKQLFAEHIWSVAGTQRFITWEKRDFFLSLGSQRPWLFGSRDG